MIAFKNRFKQPQEIPIKICDYCGVSDDWRDGGSLFILTKKDGENICVECVISNLIDEELT